MIVMSKCSTNITYVKSVIVSKLDNIYSRPSLQSHPSGPSNGVIILRCAYTDGFAI